MTGRLFDYFMTVYQLLKLCDVDKDTIE